MNTDTDVLPDRPSASWPARIGRLGFWFFLAKGLAWSAGVLWLGGRVLG